MRVETKIMAVYVFMAILAGYLSQFARNLYGELGNYVAVGIALILLVVTAEISRKLFKINNEFKWFLSNGGWIYLFVWLISWITFFNPPFSPL